MTIVFLAFEYAFLSLTLSQFRFFPPLLLLADCPSSQQHQYHEQNTRQYFLTSYGLTNVPWLNWVSGQGAGVYVQRSLFCTGVITARRQHPPATVLCHGVIAEPKAMGRTKNSEGELKGHQACKKTKFECVVQKQWPSIGKILLNVERKIGSVKCKWCLHQCFGELVHGLRATAKYTWVSIQPDGIGWV